MKYSFYLLLFLFTFSLSAQEKGGGMEFVEKPFEELLAQAKAEDKVIFIDAYTTWCGPCKMMAAKIFPDATVGTVYNERFINAKFDMEKGEGPALARRYNVVAYPTYLFVDGNGDIVHKGLGYIPQDKFLALADVAVSDNNLGALNARYKAGERSPEFVKMYAQTLTDVYEQERAGEVISVYLDSEKDWSSPEIMTMILDNPGEPGDKRMIYLVEHADAAIKTAGSASYMMTMQRSLITKYMRDAGVRALPPAEKMETVYTKWAAPIRGRLMAHYGMLHAEQSRDMDAYVPAALAYFNAYPSEDAYELDKAAWSIFENSEDMAALKVALTWAIKSVELEENYNSLDTLARLYDKVGNRAKAVETAKKAIVIAKEAGVPYEDTEELLKEK
ncbi:thioredoxin family protein [Neolewinella agarilytica]|uniref:Thioredoxin n=1 Tax=Neolewinella agarilytica TaxID=478744 RepID=A0A1H9BJP7_9BACT|nr:thioredoxin family protein [Neolewinella agarilytica]SEP88498.1 Thioredoxin [Neolewinella agarilytica]